MCESFFASLECELIERSSFETKTQAKMELFRFIEGFYNPARRHSALGYLSPVEFERRFADSSDAIRRPLDRPRVGRPDPLYRRLPVWTGYPLLRDLLGSAWSPIGPDVTWGRLLDDPNRERAVLRQVVCSGDGHRLECWFFA